MSSAPTPERRVVAQQYRSPLGRTDVRLPFRRVQQSADFFKRERPRSQLRQPDPADDCGDFRDPGLLTGPQERQENAAVASRCSARADF